MKFQKVMKLDGIVIYWVRQALISLRERIGLDFMAARR